jgi:hypothetical protein
MDPVDCAGHFSIAEDGNLSGLRNRGDVEIGEDLPPRS